MNTILSTLASFWSLIVVVFSGIRVTDFLDIAIVAFVIYKCIGFFRETRAGQLIKGLVVLLVVSLFAQWFNMVSLRWILIKVFDSAIIAAVIIFQPELRRALERVGRSKLGSLGMGQSFEDDRQVIIRGIDSVCKAAGSMQEQRIGALIVFERSTLLGDIINTGTILDAEATSALIQNIFFPNSPLHDGAMILRDGKINAAGCILPLTGNSDLNKALGTRHRAAIGMSENSDALVVVVSEETGNISIAINGQLTRGFNPITLRVALNETLLSHLEKKTRLNLFTALFRKANVEKQKPADKN